MNGVLPTVYIDMDGVIADFDGCANSLGLQKKAAAHTSGFYRNLTLMPGAIENVKKLYERFNLYIASAPKWSNPNSMIEKMAWVEQNFPYLYNEKRVLLIPNKSLLRGDFLIDDHPEWNGSHMFVGNIITFRGDWDYVWREIEALRKENA